MTNTFARRALTLGAAVAAVTAVVAGPASADVPSGWSNPSDVNPLHLLSLILFIPVAAALVISFLVLLPGVLRGEGLLPKAHAPSSEPPVERTGH
ncbi:hypothetical protein [Nocardioides nematodiphilus]|uniref:hypothetical protein n=1 Tax=Nocardioides nematodiphilus TaxID=2849669 RepID=UPI001CDA35DE|nr:hypothetical protein [Nocardioides nematodiphilus]MCA1983621.1 hypothetical protein [Nocardioides nematodiphilus]